MKKQPSTNAFINKFDMVINYEKQMNEKYIDRIDVVNYIKESSRKYANKIGKIEEGIKTNS